MFFLQTVTHGVHHIQLADDVIYTSEQLTCLIRAVAPSTGLESVTLCCPPEGATDAVVYTHKVKKIVFKQCKISMADITSLTRHLDVEHIQMDDATLRVDGEVRRWLMNSYLKISGFKQSKMSSIL